MWFCHLLHTERSWHAYWFSAVIFSGGHDLPSDPRAFSFTFFEMQSSSLRLNKGFRLSDFLKSASWIWKIFIQRFSFVTESDGFLKVLSRWAQNVSVFSRMLNSQGKWFRDANFWRMDWSLNWSYINYGDKNCVVTRWKNGKKNLDLKENLTGGCHFSNLRHICGDSFHTLQSPRVSRKEMKIYERSLQALLSLPHPHCRVSHRVPLTHVLFMIAPKWRACLQATKETIIDPNHSTFYMISMECQFSVIEEQISGPSVTLFWSAMIV